MENQPTRPHLIGKLQIKTGLKYEERGEIALWEHLDSKYLLRGYVTIAGTRYLVSLEENGTK